MFVAALLAATILPAQSETVFVGLLVAGKQSPWLLLLVASVGNVLGSCINWLMESYVERFKSRRWFPVSENSMQREQRFYQRYGKWLLLLSRLPVVGDPLTVAAGVMRERFVIFLVLVALAKTLRYVALAAVTLRAISG
jgi:membrane protein YqaA with SNARE-associated domain